MFKETALAIKFLVTIYFVITPYYLEKINEKLGQKMAFLRGLEHYIVLNSMNVLNPM